MYKTFGEKLESFGGHLECSKCGVKAELGNVGYKLSNGWTTCCGLTMTWITES